MKRLPFSHKSMLILFALIIFHFNCGKNELEPANKQSKSLLNIDQNPDNVVLNYLPDNSNASNFTHVQQQNQNLSLTDSVQKAPIDIIASSVAQCGGFFSGSHSGTGTFNYPQDTIDVSSNVEGSKINVSLNANNVPNRFRIYDAVTGSLVASSP